MDHHSFAPAPPTTAPGSGAVVAVVDSGIDPARLGAGWVLPGVNLCGDAGPDDTADPWGHGTAVAAAILAAAPGAGLVPVRVINRYGSILSLTDVERGFAWIAENRARLGIALVCAAIADASLADGDEAHRGSPLQRCIAGLRTAGTMTVVSAGNRPRAGEGPPGMAWPAILREAVSVGWLERDDGGRLRMAPGSLRLHKSAGTGCATTLFAEPGPPGGTSGAAAAVAGWLAARPPALRARLAASPSLAAEFFPDRVRDGAGRDWPALPASP